MEERQWVTIVGYFLLPIVFFILTSLFGINRLVPLLALVLLAAIIGLRFVPGVSRRWHVLLWTLLVLSMVGSTGWFFSPFFFALYLMAIALGFIYTAGVAVAFTIALVMLFAFSIGEVNPTYDFMTLLSLLSVIPITLGLRKSFLLVQQEQKGILILESEDQHSGITSLDKVLQNSVNRIGILLRQPITYIRQGLAMLNGNTLSHEEATDVLKRMTRSSEELFTLIKEFERGATKNTLINRSVEKTVVQPGK